VFSQSKKLDKLINQGIDYYKQSQYEAALECFNQAIALNPNCARAYHYRGWLHLANNNPGELLNDLQTVCRLLNDKYYERLVNKIEKIIPQLFYREDSLSWIYCEEDDSWYESYSDIPGGDIYIGIIGDIEAELMEQRSQEFYWLRNWLFARIEEINNLQLKRNKNAKFNQEKLIRYQLPLCNSHSEIAAAIGLSVNGLRYLAFSRNKLHYTRFNIPKKTGGKREISAPLPLLKKAQNWILHNILEKLEIHPAAHGFCRQKSIVTNALPHVGKDVIINIDLKDFFPSISYPQVKGLFKSLGYSETAAVVFGLICTEPRVEKLEIDGESCLVNLKERRLPQGAPSSPAISNLLCKKLDRRLSNMAKKMGFMYTRYADDLTFSCSIDSRENIGRLFKVTNLIVQEEGLAINPDKTKVRWKNRQQDVTGLVVNHKINISRKTLKKFRATLYHIEQDGFRGKHWGQTNTNDLMASIEGFANFVCMVNPEKGAKFKQQVQRIKDTYKKTDQKAHQANHESPKTSAQIYDLVFLIFSALFWLGWTYKKKLEYLRQTYGKTAIKQLRPNQQWEFLNYLLEAIVSQEIKTHLSLADLQSKEIHNFKQVLCCLDYYKGRKCKSYAIPSFIINNTPIWEDKMADYLDFLCRIYREYLRLGWTDNQRENSAAKTYLQETYHVLSPLALTLKQLQDFLEYLKLQPTPEVCSNSQPDSYEYDFSDSYEYDFSDSYEYDFSDSSDDFSDSCEYEPPY